MRTASKRMGSSFCWFASVNMAGQSTASVGSSPPETAVLAICRNCVSVAVRVMVVGLSLCFSMAWASSSEDAPTNAPSVLQITSSVSAMPRAKRYCAYSIPALRTQLVSAVRAMRSQRCHFRGRALDIVSPSGKKRKTFISISR